jgi:hypothetical protein
MVPPLPGAPVAVPQDPPDDGVDVTLIRWMLSLTPDERLDVLQGFVDSVAELSRAEPRA